MPAKLVSPPEALRLVLERSTPLEVEPVPLAEAVGRVLGEDIFSIEAVPGFDNSAMDGFALRAVDTADASPERPARLEIIGESRAGAPFDRGPGRGQAVRISTGAMLPPEADAVVRVEATDEQHGALVVAAQIEPGAEIRRAGEDIQPGELVLARGRVLGPVELGVAASVGAAELRCARQPTVTISVTGDELIEPGQPLGPGKIRNTNSYALQALVPAAGGRTVAVDRLPDDPAAQLKGLERALAADIAVVTGGVSVGPHDHVRPALESLGVTEIFWGVALRPGKPTWFGVAPEAQGRRTLVFGLPGNPVSALVTFHLFVRPAIAALTGLTLIARRTTAILDEDYSKRPGRAHAVRCRLDHHADGWHVRPTKAQGSHVLTSMLDAQALALLEIERADVSAGERVEIEILRLA